MTNRAARGQVLQLVRDALQRAGLAGMTLPDLARAVGYSVRNLSPLLYVYRQRGYAFSWSPTVRTTRWFSDAALRDQAMAAVAAHDRAALVRKLRGGLDALRRELVDNGLKWADLAYSLDEADALQRALPVAGAVPAAELVCPVAPVQPEPAAPQPAASAPRPRPEPLRQVRSPKPILGGTPVVNIRRQPMVGDAVVPAGVVVQVCPSGRDTRYTVDPASFAGGDLMAEWRARRGQA